MLAFYMDQQVRGQITHGLRQRGLDVLTAFDDGRSRLDDDALLDRATALGRIFVSQDQDVLRIGRRRQRAGEEFLGIAFAEQERVNIGKVVDYLELIAHTMSPDEMHNHVEYVPSR